MDKFKILPRLATLRINIIEILEAFINGKHWVIKITMVVFVAALFMAFPSYETLADTLNSGRALDVAMQIEDLRIFWETRNETNAVFRITVPLIAKILGLNVFGAYIIQFISGILIFTLTAVIVERETKNRTTAFIITLLIGFTYGGISAFVELRAYYDAVAILLLLLAIWSRSPFIIAPAVLMACFTDERAVIAAGFVAIWWALQQPIHSKEINLFINLRTIAVVIAVILYLAARLVLMQDFGLSSFNESTGEFQVFNQINNAPMGLWTGLEGGWLIVILSLWTLISKKRLIILITFLLVIFVQIIGALAVVDITRSMAYLLPALFVAIAILQKETSDDLEIVYLISAVISIGWLTYYAGGKSSIWLVYPLPIQVIRWIIKL